MIAKMHFESGRNWVWVAVLLALAGSAPLAGQSYDIADLGTLPNGFVSGAFGLNDLGHTAGVSGTPASNLRGFFEASNVFYEIPPLAGDTQTHAMALNAGDTVAVMSYKLGELGAHGLLYNGGAVTPLDHLAPRGLNDAGVAVGYVTLQDTSLGWIEHAGVVQNGTTFDLGTLGGHTSYAAAINNWPARTIVGWSLLADETTLRAAIWPAGLPARDLGTLGGAASQAYGINDQGDVVGWAETAAGTPHGFLYQVDSAGTVLARTDLGELGGGYSYAYGVNSLHQVVGASDGRAFLYRNGQMYDLATLAPRLPAGWRLDTAWAINAGRAIVGAGVLNGQPHAYLALPLCPGDTDCDGLVNWRDIDYLVAGMNDNRSAWVALFAPGTPGCPFANLDTSGDGAVNWRDIDPFIALMNTTCP